MKTRRTVPTEPRRSRRALSETAVTAGKEARLKPRTAHRFVVGAACLANPLSIGNTHQLEHVSAAGGTLAGGAGHVIACTPCGIDLIYRGGGGAPSVD